MSTPLITRLLTRHARPWIAGHSAYAVYGVIAALVGSALVLAISRGTSAATLASVLVTPPAAFGGTLALARRGWWPRRIVFYQKAVLALAATGGVLAAARAEITHGLDLAATGVLAFLAIGRLGCFSVSCCHGKRAGAGVRYTWEHARGGFPARWVGAALFPAQLVDSALALTAASIGAVMVVTEPPGGAIAAIACVYGSGRFVLELARGDELRPYVRGLSAAQWMAIATTAAAAFGHPAAWTIATAAALAGAGLVLALAPHFGWLPRVWLTEARHLEELDAVLERVIADAAPLTTSRGLEIGLRSRDRGFSLVLSHPRAALSRATRLAIARQLGRAWTLSLDGDELVVVREVSRDVLVG